MCTEWSSRSRIWCYIFDIIFCVWCDMIWYYIISHYIISYHIISYSISYNISYNILSYDIKSYHIISHYILLNILYLECNVKVQIEYDITYLTSDFVWKLFDNLFSIFSFHFFLICMIRIRVLFYFFPLWSNVLFV